MDAGLDVRVLAELVPADDPERIRRRSQRGRDLAPEGRAVGAGNDRLAAYEARIEAGRRGRDPEAALVVHRVRHALQLVLEGLDRNRQDSDALAENGDPASVSDEALQLRKREIEAQLLAALASGDPVEVTPAFWEERRRVLEERLA